MVLLSIYEPFAVVVNKRVADAGDGRDRVGAARIWQHQCAPILFSGGRHGSVDANFANRTCRPKPS
jgi:hypothetical protein